MARVLVYTAPGSGHAYPPVATALALRDRGHEVVVRTASGSVDAIGRLGLSAAPIDPHIEAIPLEDWKTRTSIGALVSACNTFAKRARYEIPYLQAAIEAVTEDDATNRRFIRADLPDFSPLLPQELDIYREALLIFYGKASIYLRAMGRELPGDWQAWIG